MLFSTLAESIHIPTNRARGFPLLYTLSSIVCSFFLKWWPFWLATWCKELTHWKRTWCWERLKAGGEGDDRGSDGWMASLTRCRWVWASSRSWCWTGKPGVLQSIGSQRVGHSWAMELNSDWCEVITHSFDLHFSNNEQCWVSFHVFNSHLYVFFGEISALVFSQLCYCVVCSGIELHELLI